MSEREAFLFNAAENTNRDNLTPPDIFGIVAKGVKDFGMSWQDVAIQLGKSPSIVKNYASMTKLSPYILAHWRTGGDFEGVKTAKRVGVVDMFELAKLPSGEQVAAYKKALDRQVQRVDSSAWLEKAKHRATAMGTLLARLQKSGLLSVHSGQQWIAHVDILVRVGKKELRWKDAQALAKLAEGGYARELARPIDETHVIGVEPHDTDVPPLDDEKLS
jgi:hypothetical protein